MSASVGLLPRRSAIGAALFALVVFTPTILAQGSLPDTVRGIVFDSLTSTPLAGAMIVAAPSGAITSTDSLGQFTLISEVRVESLVAYHDVLDQTGFGVVGSTRPSNARVWRDARMATPSLSTLWRTLCGQSLPSSERTDIITGTARLADNTTRVSGAKVIVQWPRLTGNGSLVSAESVTDSLGNYLVCGVQAFATPSLLAISAEAQSGVIALPSEMRPLRRVDLLLSMNDVPATGTVRGRVVSDAGRGVSGMSVQIDGLDAEVVTDESGAFAFTNVPYGSRMLQLRGIGYTPIGQVVEVREGATPSVTIHVARAIELEGVTVIERATVRRERAEFEMRRRAGWGRFVDSMDLARAVHVRAALDRIPGVRVLSPTVKPPERLPMGTGGIDDRGSATEWRIFGRACQAYVYVDGILDSDNLANRIPKEQLAAIEVYRSSGLAPARFISVKDDCPVVLVWTKFGLRP